MIRERNGRRAEGHLRHVMIGPRDADMVGVDIKKRLCAGPGPRQRQPVRRRKGIRVVHRHGNRDRREDGSIARDRHFALPRLVLCLGRAKQLFSFRQKQREFAVRVGLYSNLLTCKHGADTASLERPCERADSTRHALQLLFERGQSQPDRRIVAGVRIASEPHEDIHGFAGMQRNQPNAGRHRLRRALRVLPVSRAADGGAEQLFLVMQEVDVCRSHGVSPCEVRDKKNRAVRERREAQRGFLILRAGMEQEPAGNEVEAVDLARPLVRALGDRTAHRGPVVGPPASEPFTGRAGGVVAREGLLARYGIAVGPRFRRVGAGVERLNRVPGSCPGRGQ